MPTLFYTHTNNGRAKLTSPHTIGDGKLTVDSPSSFGVAPFHVTAVNSGTIAIFLITSKTGNDLNIGGMLGGTSDIALLSNASIEERFIKEDVVAIEGAINNLETSTTAPNGILKGVSGSLTAATAGTDFIYPGGVAGGQTIYGGTAASNNLTLNSTSNSTKGYILLGSGGLVGINKSVPSAQLHMSSVATNRTGLIIQAIPSQTANLQEWQNSSGTAFSYIDNNCDLNTPGNLRIGLWITNGSGWQIVGNGASIAGYNNAFQMDGGLSEARLVMNATGLTFSRPNAGYNLFTIGFTGGVSVLNQTSTTTALIVKSAASQSANILECQNTSGTILISVGPNGHLHLAAATPTIAAGTGAGTSPTISITGSDQAGYISLTTGTSPTASATVTTITFGSAFSATPRNVMLTPGGPNATALSGATAVYVDQSSTSTTAWVIKVGSGGLIASTTYVWYYSVMG